jgi:glycosyltransferase involved in cell wall biosynthesis
MPALVAKPPIVVVTDHVGEGATNGAQVFANALLMQLAQWFDLTVVAAHSNAAPECLAEKIVLAASGENGEVEIPSSIVRQLRLQSASLIYNLGATSFSCAVTEKLHTRAPKVSLVNHFQVLLDVCAEFEGWSSERARELAQPQRSLATIAARNLFTSFSELSTASARWDCADIPNYVVPNAFVGIDVGERPPTPGTQFMFLAAGRFSDYVKGADLLYRAFADLHRTHPWVRLEIASDDTRFLELLKPLPSASWTRLGWLDRADMLRRMRIADAVVVPSRYEPFGLVAVESMAMGTPVIAMAVGGLAEIICHGVTGWLCPPEEGSLGLRLMMDLAVRNRPRTLVMGQEAQQFVEREYSLARVAQAVRTHLENVCHSGRKNVEALLAFDTKTTTGAP